MNEDKSETTGQRTDDPMLDHACTMRIALAIARRQNELDLRLHRIEQALKLGGHANFPSTDRNQPTTQKNKERTDNGRNTVDHDRIHVRARREEHHRGPFQSQRDHLLAQDQHRRKLDPHPIHDPEHPVRPDPVAFCSVFLDCVEQEEHAFIDLVEGLRRKPDAIRSKTDLLDRFGDTLRKNLDRQDGDGKSIGTDRKGPARHMGR